MDKKVLEVVLELRDKLGPHLKRVASASKGSLTGMSRAVEFVKKNWIALAAVITGVILILRRVGRFIGESIRLANEQEVAVKGLNAALAAQGQFTEEASQAIQEYASSMQMQIGIGDEVLINIAKQISALSGLSADALPKAIKATIQLSNVAGVDLNNAGLLLGKTLGSTTNALVRYGVEIDGTADKLTKLDAIIEATSAGMDIAIATTNTFEGATRVLGTVWGDLKEVIGANITQSPAMIAALKGITQAIFNQTMQMQQAGEEGENLIDRLVKSTMNAVTNILKFLAQLGVGIAQIRSAFIVAGKQTAQFIIGLGHVLLSFMRSVAGNVEKMINAIVGGLNTLIGGLNKIPGVTIAAVGKVSISVGGLDTAIGGLQASFLEIDDQIKTTRDNLFNLGVSTNLYLDDLNALNKSVQNAVPSIVDYSESLGGVASALGGEEGGEGGGGGGGVIGKIKVFTGLAGGFKNAWQPVVDMIDVFAEKIEELNRQMDAWATKLPTARDFEMTDAMGFRGELPLGTTTFKRPGTRLDVSAEFAKAIGGGGKDEAGKGFFTDLFKGPGFKGFEDAAFQGQFLGAVGGAAISGGGRGAVGAALPLIGSLFGPAGSAIGGLLGGLFGKKKPRGQTRSQPQYVHIVNTEDVGTQMLNAVKTLLLGRAGGGIDQIGVQLKAQAARMVI